MRRDRVRVDWSWFKTLQNGVELSNPLHAAALLSRSWFYGNTARERIALVRGNAFEYNPGTLGLIQRYVHFDKRLLCVVFTVNGDASALALRRLWFAQSMIYVDPKQYKKMRALLLSEIDKSIADADKRLRDYLTVKKGASINNETSHKTA